MGRGERIKHACSERQLPSQGHWYRRQDPPYRPKEVNNYYYYHYYHYYHFQNINLA